MTSAWEIIDSNFSEVKIRRMKTPLGWLLRTDDGESLVFILDDKNEWKDAVKLEFSSITNSGKENYLRRAKIPGGWLLARFSDKRKRTYEGDEIRIRDKSIGFVPDTNWEWEI